MRPYKVGLSVSAMKTHQGMKGIMTILAAACCVAAGTFAATPEAQVTQMPPVPDVPAYAGTPGAKGLEIYDSVPPAWSYTPQVPAVAPADDQWWNIFGDDRLVALIRQAGENSLNLRMTLRRIEMARNAWKAAQAGWYPTIGLSAGWTKNRSSGDMSGTGRPVTVSYFDLGLNFNWEIDVFGRVAAQVNEGKAAYNASRAEYDAAMISLAANIATAYTNLLLAQEQIQLAQEQIKTQEKIHDITTARHECGLASKLDVTQSLSVLYSTQASLPTLKQQERAALNSLAMLTGCYADRIEYLIDHPGKMPNPFVMTEIGVPADLLRRRPDIIQAEYQVAQYAAALGVAKKDFLPTLSLTGSVGTSAHSIKDLFTKDSFTYTFAPQLTWTIFEGLARKYRVAEARQQVMSSIDNYNLTVMNAVTETDDALQGYRYALERIGLIQKVCDQSHESLELSLDRYKRGLAPFTDVMNSLISLLEYENTLLQSKASALADAIRIYQCVAGNPVASDK